MARLRRESPESFHAGEKSDGADSRGHARLASASRHATLRTSPRKKAPKTYFDPEISDKSEDFAPTRSSDNAQRRKQIRLTPLNSLRTKTSNFTGQPTFETPGKHCRRQKPLFPENLLIKSDYPTAQASKIDFDQPKSIVDGENDDVEGSIWCGSESESDSFMERFPSPRRFIKALADKTRRCDQSLSEQDLTSKIDRLSTSDSKLPSDPITSNISETCAPSPRSSMEMENLAFLRFSPPRLHSPKKQRTSDRPVTPPTASPSKGKLLSPSKRAARIPTPPLRPSLEGFWNAETINDWNDQHSPRKGDQSPHKLRALSDQVGATPTSSTRKSPTKRTKAEIQARKDWETRKHDVAETFFRDLDKAVTQGKIQELALSTGGVRFTWSKTLNSTAGRANWRRETTKTRQLDGTTIATHKHYASIELAEKVINDEHRLLNVIAHEFCHLCNFMISGIKDQPHGRHFKEWGRKCTAAFGDRGIEVTTKHTYEIEYKYIWRCSNEECATEFKRHSKSIDPKRHTCGACRSQIIQIKPAPRKMKDGTAHGNAVTTGYAAYVKLHYGKVKSGLRMGASQKEIMEAIAKQYRADKASSDKSSDLIPTLAATATGLRVPEIESNTSSKATQASHASKPHTKGYTDLEIIARGIEVLTVDEED